MLTLMCRKINPAEGEASTESLPGLGSRNFTDSKKTVMATTQ